MKSDAERSSKAFNSSLTQRRDHRAGEGELFSFNFSLHFEVPSANEKQSRKRVENGIRGKFRLKGMGNLFTT